MTLKLSMCFILIFRFAVLSVCESVGMQTKHKLKERQNRIISNVRTCLFVYFQSVFSSQNFMNGIFLRVRLNSVQQQQHQQHKPNAMCSHTHTNQQPGGERYYGSTIYITPYIFL